MRIIVYTNDSTRRSLKHFLQLSTLHIVQPHFAIETPSDELMLIELQTPDAHCGAFVCPQELACFDIVHGY
jgi:hypothetical protein